jgi:predicted TPR repeat methyltransferase
VEDHAGPEPLVLLPTRRYAHSEKYIDELAAANDFRVTRVARAPLRDHRWEQIPGACFWLERNG